MRKRSSIEASYWANLPTTRFRNCRRERRVVSIPLLALNLLDNHNHGGYIATSIGIVSGAATITYVVSRAHRHAHSRHLQSPRRYNTRTAAVIVQVVHDALLQLQDDPNHQDRTSAASFR